MKYRSKSTKNKNNFILYDNNGETICYFDNFNELSKYINYTQRDLIKEFNKNKTDIIKIIIDNKKYELAIFC